MNEFYSEKDNLSPIETKSTEESRSFAEAKEAEESRSTWETAPVGKEKKKRKFKFDAASLATSFVVAAVALVAVILPASGFVSGMQTKAELSGLVAGEASAAYTVVVRDEKPDGYSVALYNASYRSEKKITERESSGEFTNLKPDTLYTFELVSQTAFGKQTIVKKQIKTHTAPPPDPDTIKRGRITKIEVSRDFANNILNFTFKANDPDGVLNDFAAKLVSEASGTVYDIALTEDISLMQSFDYSSLSGGIYTLEVSARSSHPLDGGKVALINKIRL